METNVRRTVPPDEDSELLAAAKPFEADDVPYQPPARGGPKRVYGVGLPAQGEAANAGAA
jgi:hypothetical protein